MHCHTQGSGPDLVLLHGWGMHGGLWQPVMDRLTRHWRVTVADLPGHGHSLLTPGGFDLSRLAAMALNSVPAPAYWIGWSLGGLVATQAARLQPSAIHGLCLVNSLPKFVQATDWPHAMPLTTLTQFAANLEQDCTLTLQRFLALQVRGSANERETLRHIRALIASRPPAQPEALRLGLDVLRTTDLRADIKCLDCPAHYILGERDTIAPAAAAPALQTLSSDVTVTTLAGAGHAPFLSHDNTFFTTLNEFLHATR